MAELSKLNLTGEITKELRKVPIATIEQWGTMDKIRDENGRIRGTDNDYKGVKFYIHTDCKALLDRICHITGTNQSQLMRNLIINYLIDLRND